jgi:hypothetical protein
MDICCIRVWGVKRYSALRLWFWLEDNDLPISTIRDDLLVEYSRRRNRTLRSITTTVDREKADNLKPKKLTRAAKRIRRKPNHGSLLSFPASDVDIINAYKEMRSTGDGDLRPMLNEMVSHIGWGGFPGLRSGIEELLGPVLGGILEEEDLGDNVASEVQNAIETASEETFHNARKLLKRLRADILRHKHIIRLIAETSGNDGSGAEAIYNEYEAKALSPGHIFIPFLGILRVLHSGCEETTSLLEIMKKLEDPLVNEKAERVLGDPAAMKEVVENILTGMSKPGEKCGLKVSAAD